MIKSNGEGNGARKEGREGGGKEGKRQQGEGEYVQVYPTPE